jgi:multidrug efflux pump
MSQKSFTDFFVSHPVFAWVANIILVLLGVTTFFQLTVRQFPATEGSVITVRTNMDASSKVMESQVTKPLEDAFASIQGLDGMESETQKDETKVTLSFQGRSLDAASADIRDILSRIKLPDEAQTIVTKGDVDAAAVMELVLYGDKVPISELYNTAETSLKSLLESTPGVATVEISGGSDLRMNIELDPVKMAAYSITPSDVVMALKRHNLQKSAGRIVTSEQEFVLTTQACLRTPKEFGDIAVSHKDDKTVRLADIGSSNICPAEEQVKVLYNGNPAVSLTIRPQSGASPVEISKEVRDRISKAINNLPTGAVVDVAMDKALYIKDSIRQVYQTLIEAVVLVLLVILFFLRSVRASLVPLVTIPLSLVTTFFIMYVLGFSINTLSLLALVLAIGLVVDDAIVVLENIYRYMEEGKSPLQATLLGAREIRFSVIAMTLTLAAVYAPIAVAPGLIGKVFKEFALTLAGAVIVSGFVALTLSPLMCSRLVRAHTVSGPLWVQKISNTIEKWLNNCERFYLKILDIALSHKMVMISAAIGFSFITGLVGVYGLRKELAPPSDEGLLMVKFIAPPSKNLNYISNRAVQMDALLKQVPEATNRLLTLQTMRESFSQSVLTPWEKRQRSCRDIAMSLRSVLKNVQGMDGYARCPSSSIIANRGGGSGQVSMSFRILTNRPEEELNRVGRLVTSKLRRFPGIEYLDPSEVAQQPEYSVKVDRQKIAQLGIDPEEVAETLRILVRGTDVGRFEMNGKMYPVRVWMAQEARQSLEDISSVFLRGQMSRLDKKASMIPLREVISFEQKMMDPVINHYMKRRSYDVVASLKPGYGLADVYLKFKDSIRPLIPTDYEIEPAGELKRYFQEQGAIYLVFGLSILFIFLIMAAQFESFRAPLIIMLSVPLALGGATVSLLFAKNGSFNVYSQIGFVTLVGLITKHGILLVDFANQQVKAGMTLDHAMREACKLRLRPILMTTLAMVLGAIPLMIATGAGSEGRRQIGTVIVGGMTWGTLLTLFVVPVVYILLMRQRKQENRELEQLNP